jgi:hypothetical protein
MREREREGLKGWKSAQFFLKQHGTKKINSEERFIFHQIFFKSENKISNEKNLNHIFCHSFDFPPYIHYIIERKKLLLTIVEKKKHEKLFTLISLPLLLAARHHM